jgi:hypothetical protein
MIGEGADTRQRLIRGASHRGPSQDKGEGKDEAEGPHLTVSPVVGPALPAVSLSPVNAMLFPYICAKTENGFVAQGNCFVGCAGRNNRGKTSIDSERPPRP